MVRFTGILKKIELLEAGDESTEIKRKTQDNLIRFNFSTMKIYPF
jgi:hypothetical protein